MIKKTFPIILFSILLIGCGGNSKDGNDDNGSNGDGNGGDAMTATELMKEYLKAKEEAEMGEGMNPLEDKYKGKEMSVKGTVKGLTNWSDSDGNSGKAINLKVDKEGKMADDVMGALKDGSKADELEEGMKVKIMGTYTSDFLGPSLMDCEVEVLEE